MATPNNTQISNETIYQSIRVEILDQKKCQFQIFSVAVAITSVVLAYALRNHAQGFALLAPIVMNTLALVIIVDKAISIQRKVGYLQVMEEGVQKDEGENIPPVTFWKWESHLEEYRGLPTGEAKRNHSYITYIGCMLLVLNLFCLGFLGLILIEEKHPDTATEKSSPYKTEKMVLTSAFASSMFLFGLGTFIKKRYSLIHGENQSNNIRQAWLKIIKEDKMV